MPDLLSMLKIGLIKELSHASDQLESAMGRYAEACAAILDYHGTNGDTAQDLLDNVMAELPRAFNYKSTLQKAMVFMWRVRNQSPSFVPISLLPPEILSRIFCFSERCCLPKSRITRRDAHNNGQLVYPEVALEVCHRWRQAALASHDLWSHIDIDLTSGSEGKLFSRALALSARSKQVSIDLHTRIDFYCRDDQRFVDFCHSIVPRTRSFDFQCDGRSSLPRNPLSLWASMLSWATPGTLKTLFIDAQPMREPGFVTLNDPAPSNYDARLLQIMPVSEQIFEDILSPITSLKLDGMYPYWTSRAYVGLIELDLKTSNNTNISISEFELANVLRASPGLRVFRFRFKMTFEWGITSTTPDPIHLNYLEIIQLGGRYPIAQETILRMISIHPGQLPLQMLAEVTEHFSLLSPYWDQFLGFITRSKITQLQIQGVAPFKIHLGLSELSLFPLLPQLQILTWVRLCLARDVKNFLEITMQLPSSHCFRRMIPPTEPFASYAWPNAGSTGTIFDICLRYTQRIP
ncbi:unnamed protein product [Rhizoctonia solani]|uniref:F-box domain-containing protein n=1 Tax=Rhizoctonia solani TaxID=456999 RepID=A0A8H3AX62_9AGAM|nr:unnamed protein product [Rhizoctonia solani]